MNWKLCFYTAYSELCTTNARHAGISCNYNIFSWRFNPDLYLFTNLHDFPGINHKLTDISILTRIPFQISSDSDVIIWHEPVGLLLTCSGKEHENKTWTSQKGHAADWCCPNNSRFNLDYKEPTEIKTPGCSWEWDTKLARLFPDVTYLLNPCVKSLNRAFVKVGSSRYSGWWRERWSRWSSRRLNVPAVFRVAVQRHASGSTLNCVGNPSASFCVEVPPHLRLSMKVSTIIVGTTIVSTSGWSSWNHPLPCRAVDVDAKRASFFCYAPLSESVVKLVLYKLWAFKVNNVIVKKKIGSRVETCT